MPDQDAVHKVLYEEGFSLRLGLRVLPMHFFPNGYILMFNLLPMKHLLRPLVVHFNWIPDPKNKKQKMIDFNCWFVEKDLGTQLETLRKIVEPDAIHFTPL